MGFNRENYAKIKQEYDGKYLRAQSDAKLRRAEIHASIPEIAQIDRELSKTGLEIPCKTQCGFAHGILIHTVGACTHNTSEAARAKFKLLIKSVFYFFLVKNA
jgi:hypothetical protein